MDEVKAKIFYLKKKVIFPNCTMPVSMSLSRISENLAPGERIIAYPIRSILDVFFHRHRLATLSEVVEVKKEKSILRLILKGLSRVRIRGIRKFQLATASVISHEAEITMSPSADILRKKSQELIFLINIDESDRLIQLLTYLIDMDQLTDFIANYFVIDFTNRYRIYTDLDVHRRGEKLLAILDVLTDDMKAKREKEMQ